MKKLHLLVSSITMVLMFSTNAFAATYEIEIDGQTVQVETIGDVEVVDITNPLYDCDFSNGEWINGEIVYTDPENTEQSSERLLERSAVESFSFETRDKQTTIFEYNPFSNWTVTTKAHLLNIKTGVSYTSSEHYYIVSIMEDINTPLFSYKGKADDVKGGIKFTNVPKGKNLAIQVKNETKLPNNDTYLKGTGATTFK
ncbi:hypothetical protein K413DRAFT_4780 [Clostridium sp. ASBs410]|nr:hypothetical protein K413DRAFT_4780 [Clostridium sp. ASBs410]